MRVGGGWKIFQKLISGGGDDYSVLESRQKIFQIFEFDYVSVYYSFS